MKHLLLFTALFVTAMPAFAATPAGTGRRSIQSQMVTPASRVSNDNVAAMASMQVMKPVVVTDVSDKSSVRPPVDTTTPVVANQPEVVVNNREKERSACIQNNIGVGNTFVWASRYSNTANYTTMVEDVENPDNNTCFVKVEVKSSDPKISVSDIPAVYYEMGRNIECGAWADEDKLEKRILDAKKNARTWATVGGAVGGAALGVGSMELFGNKLIGGAVEGQKDKSLSDSQRLRSQILALKNDNPGQYNELMTQMKQLQTACDSWEGGDQKPEGCTKYDYTYILSIK